MKVAIPHIKKKILRLQKKIGLDLTQKDIGLKLKKLPKSEKLKIKTLLEEIKINAIQKDTVEDMLEKLQDKVINEDTDSLFIEVENHIIPDTQIIIGRVKKDITSPEKSVIFKEEYNQIVITHL